MKTRTASIVITVIVALGAASTASAKAPSHHVKQHASVRVAHVALVKSSKSPARMAPARRNHYFS